MKKRRVTMADVAREVGCCKATVSYAIMHNHPISEETRRKVYAAIERLGYQPCIDQKKKMIRTVALINGIGPTYLSHGLELQTWYEELSRQGYQMINCYLPIGNFSPEAWSALSEALNSFSALAGLISIHPNINSFDLIKRIKNVPQVIFGRPDSMLCSVPYDIDGIGDLIAREFIRLQCRSAAYFLFDELHSEDNEKILGSLARNHTLMQSGFTLEPYVIMRDALSPYQISLQMEKMMAAGHRVILTQNTMFGEKILQWCYPRKLRIPDDISVFTIDFEHLAGSCSPPLSAIEFSVQEAIRYSVEMLCAKIERRDPPQKELRAHWLERGSTRQK